MRRAVDKVTLPGHIGSKFEIFVWWHPEGLEWNIKNS